MAGRGGPHNVVHGMYHLPEYGHWIEMRRRCRTPNRHNARSYTHRNIRVSERWDSFATFYKDMGPMPSPKHTLDRIDNAGNYEPGNVRWATRKTQSQNARTVFVVTLDDEKIGVREMARRLAMKPWRLYQYFNEKRSGRL